jgi:hypothetical protein
LKEPTQRNRTQTMTLRISKELLKTLGQRETLTTKPSQERG